MAKYCKEVQEWIEEKVEKPIETWVEKEERKCKRRKCKWWCGCCNKWVCWIETTVVKVVKWVVVTVGKWVTRVVCEVIHIVLDLVGIIVGLIFAIPIIGRLVREMWDFIIEAGHRIMGLPGLIADLFGWSWRKRLRVCVVILSDGEGPMATETSLTPAIEGAKRIFLEAANVEILVHGIHTSIGSAPSNALDVSCSTGAWGDDLWTPGSYFEFQANRFCADGAGRRLIGWAAPITVFVVREVDGSGTAGCSLGPLSDYVTVEGPDAACFAHELGHACGLWHVSEDNNLLNPSCGGETLKKWQKVILRDSRHVSYL